MGSDRAGLATIGWWDAAPCAAGGTATVVELAICELVDECRARVGLLQHPTKK